MNYWVQAIRPKTIPASLGPILLGTALASEIEAIHWPIFFIALICALSLQIAVNLANDLFDGLAGIDTEERLGPPRMVQSGCISARAMSIALALVTALAITTGLLLAAATHWTLLLVGFACIAAVFAYSAGPWPLASLGLGEVAVLAFFGWVAVAGSYWLQTDNVSMRALAYGTSAGLFSVALLLVNNIRDISTDKTAGKYTLAVRLGENRSRAGYVLVMMGALLTHLATSLPDLWLTVIPLLACGPGVTWLAQRIRTTRGRALNALLARTAQIGLLYCGTTALLLTL